MKDIGRLVRKLGIHTGYAGYKFMVYGIQLAMADSSRLQTVTKLLYPDIAKEFDIDRRCVERDLRTVINACWVQDDSKTFLCTIADRNLLDKPKTAEFISIASEYAKREPDEDQSSTTNLL